MMWLCECIEWTVLWTRIEWWLSCKIHKMISYQKCVLNCFLFTCWINFQEICLCLWKKTSCSKKSYTCHFLYLYVDHFLYYLGYDCTSTKIKWKFYNFLLIQIINKFAQMSIWCVDLKNVPPKDAEFK